MTRPSTTFAARRRPAAGALVAVLGAIGAGACATSGASVEATAAVPPPAPPAASPPAAAVEPPPFAAAAAPAPSRADRDSVRRREIFDAAWTLVRDKYFDTTFGGHDWNALRAKYEPLAVGAPTEAAFYRAANDMLAELGQSHMEILGPGSDGDDEGDAGGADGGGSGGGPGDPGLTVRIIEDRPVVTRVRRGSSADRASIKAGFVVTHVGGRPVRASAPRHTRSLRPVEDRFLARVAIARRLTGAAGSRVTVRFLDQDDRPEEVMLEREPPRVPAVALGWLPPLYPEVRTREVAGVGVIAFNYFLVGAMLSDIENAIERFRDKGVRGIVLDIRGNPGGQGAVAIPLAAHLTREPLTLGTLQFRDSKQTFTARPSIGVEPFMGPVAIVVDEGSASTAEIFASGMQEARRAKIVGDQTPGFALPSLIETLPHGAVMQFVVADFRTPKGTLVEGRGVTPDLVVRETRAALRSGRDPVLDAAVEAVRASRSP